jgi:DNA-binding response OmpR family regulator
MRPEGKAMAVAATKSKWFYVFDEPTRILVVDDDPILREFSGVYLSSPFAHVIAVAGGEAALEAMRSDSFHIVLVDIDMPGMNGFELVEQIRADDRLRNLPVVMLTGREDIASIDRAYQAGATSFATKPVNWRLLSYHLRYVIRSNRVGAGAPAQPATSAELAKSLQKLAGAAEQMSSLPDHTMQAAQAREIAATAQGLLRKFSGTTGGIKQASPGGLDAGQLEKTG